VAARSADAGAPVVARSAGAGAQVARGAGAERRRGRGWSGWRLAEWCCAHVISSLILRLGFITGFRNFLNRYKICIPLFSQMLTDDLVHNFGSNFAEIKHEQRSNLGNKLSSSKA
jgi:hypothetical protein